MCPGVFSVVFSMAVAPFSPRDIGSGLRVLVYIRVREFEGPGELNFTALCKHPLPPVAAAAAAAVLAETRNIRNSKARARARVRVSRVNRIARCACVGRSRADKRANEGAQDDPLRDERKVCLFEIDNKQTCRAQKSRNNRGRFSCSCL